MIQILHSSALCLSRRYKMISQFTWPNHDLPSDKDAVKRLLQGCGFDQDAAYGKTKVFIRTPRTLFSLEEQRAEMVQRIVLFLQKVRLQPFLVVPKTQILLITDKLHTKNPPLVVFLLHGCMFTCSKYLNIDSKKSAIVINT